MSRPTIPAAIKRQILVEAGHRCAIPTCKEARVEIHHIIPWSSLQEHTVENLIALCPNCHSRAELGEIDRKSLRMYKSQLIARGSYRNHNVVASEARKNSVVNRKTLYPTRLNKKKIREIKKEPPAYEISTEYPNFASRKKTYQEINVLERAFIYEKLLEARGTYSGEVEEDDIFKNIPSELSISFDVTLFTKDVLSIRYAIYQYGSGAAHGLYSTRVAIYFLSPTKKIELYNILREDGEHLQPIVDYCISDLRTQVIAQGWEDECETEYEEDDGYDYLERRRRNLSFLSNFNLTNQGILFTFEPEVINCFAAGTYEVLIPARLCKDHISKIPKIGVGT